MCSWVTKEQSHGIPGDASDASLGWVTGPVSTAPMARALGVQRAGDGCAPGSSVSLAAETGVLGGGQMASAKHLPGYFDSRHVTPGGWLFLRAMFADSDCLLLPERQTPAQAQLLGNWHRPAAAKAAPEPATSCSTPDGSTSLCTLPQGCPWQPGSQRCHQHTSSGGRGGDGTGLLLKKARQRGGVCCPCPRGSIRLSWPRVTMGGGGGRLSTGVLQPRSGEEVQIGLRGPGGFLGASRVLPLHCSRF